MFKKFLLLGFSLALFLDIPVFSQAKPVFTGDPEKFREELLLFTGADLSQENSALLSSFLSKFDSSAFSAVNRTMITDLSAMMGARQMRAVPSYLQFLKALNDFSETGKEPDFLRPWLSGLKDILSDPSNTNESVTRFILTGSLIIRENLLISSGTVKWKVSNNGIRFVYDTIFKVALTNATLTCFSQRDSSMIYDVSGFFLPDQQLLKGTKGVVTWEKAGYPRGDVFAEMDDYTINITRNNFSCDSARLTHKTYFREPVYGLLSDQAASIPSPDRASYPRFETYLKEFKIKKIYDGIDYEGGLLFEGAQVKGKGENNLPAKLLLYRNDTLFIRISSPEFVFSLAGLNAMQTAATLYLGTDSIFHSNLGFTFNARTRQVNLYRNNNPVSGSPYYDSFHSMDMYFENLSWDMNSTKVLASRARGAALGQALFESETFFNADYFLNLMGLDEYHPLTRLKQFSEYYYSLTFPVSEFAKWLNKPEETVTGLCIDMANKGFVFFDRTRGEVTIKQKLFDYIDAFTKKRDYDILTIYSETKAPVDNAVLDLKDFGMTVYGVKSVFLSDSQKVAIYPYNQKLTIGRNRDISFDGVVRAGLFTIYGHDFRFSYDTFKIRLHKIDSIKIAVETDKKDAYGNLVASEINNLIELATGVLYIDDPSNKSGLKSLAQYPIIDARTFSYIYYDKIPGMEDVYRKENFYFKVDPFTYENLDHYKADDLSLTGEFVGGNILRPMKQYLTIQEDNSLGFKMDIPPQGIDVYEGKGMFHEFISMSNKGLKGKGMLKHLTSTTISDEFSFFPDSMITKAVTFNIGRNGSGLFPDTKSVDVKIKWLPVKDEWYAYNSSGKSFDMFSNGTTLDGNLKLTPSLLSGTGVINMPDSRIVSRNFTFSSDQIKADTADYNLKSPSGDSYAFIAENASTDINFATKITRFHLNTDSSVVKFPEIQYICTMTDFGYDMDDRILNMEQKGKGTGRLLTPDQLLKVSFRGLDKPTFFATNSLSDTISFTSLKARYFVNKEYIEAENINYIHVADALIQPDSGKITIDRRAKIRKLTNATIAVNNLHLLHSGDIDIESTKRYSGSAVYEYVDESRTIRKISFPEINVDTLTTTAKGFIAEDETFMLSPAFTFAGDVFLSARLDHLKFTGWSGIVHDCQTVKSYPVKFSALIDPANVMIPVTEKPRDNNDNLLYTGTYLSLDSALFYPAFLSQERSYTDVGLVKASGLLRYDKSKDQYQIASLEKLADPAAAGNMIRFGRNLCMLSGEGSVNISPGFDLVKMAAAGSVVHKTDSAKVEIDAMFALDFHFSPEALKVMSDEIRLMPSLKPVPLNSTFYNNGMKIILGTGAATQMKEDLDLFGGSHTVPKEFTYELLINKVNLYWNEATSSFRSKGRIGLGYVATQPLNVYVDGYIEIQRRRSGDLIDIYLKADESTWYYFSYFRGVMMVQSSSRDFNTIIVNTKIKDRRHPDSSVRVPYTYMIAVEDRLARFLQRMEEDSAPPESDPLEGLIR